MHTVLATLALSAAAFALVGPVSALITAALVLASAAEGRRQRRLELLDD
jgi:hypothetical protein